MRQPNSYARGELVVVVDCADLGRAAEFWTAVLGYADGGGGDTYRSLLPADGAGAEVLLQRTADAKQGKNRLHLDIHSEPGGLDALVARLEQLGATRVREVDQGPAGHWWLMQDPEGNEFCAA